MDIVTILRDLWRRRLLVACVAALALLAGIAVAYRVSFPPKLESRKYEVGVATASIFLDTPSSQVVEVDPKGSDSLGTRANLIASLMVDGEVKDAIARRAGLPPGQLVALTDPDPEQTPTQAPESAKSNVLHTHVVTNTVGAQLPIIEITAQSHDAQSAARLANAAVTGLRDYLDSKAALQRVPDAKRLKISGLGAPQASDVVRGPGTVLALAAAILVLLAGCASILAATALARSWREASEEEQEEAAAVVTEQGSWNAGRDRAGASKWRTRFDDQAGSERASELIIESSSGLS
jgi:capsular polysaccharide biosynthesis protein